MRPMTLYRRRKIQHWFLQISRRMQTDRKQMVRLFQYAGHLKISRLLFIQSVWDFSNEDKTSLFVTVECKKTQAFWIRFVLWFNIVYYNHCIMLVLWIPHIATWILQVKIQCNIKYLQNPTFGIRTLNNPAASDLLKRPQFVGQDWQSPSFLSSTRTRSSVSSLPARWVCGSMGLRK